MRKCGSCGYLLFADVDGCKHCGAPVEELTAVAGAAVPASPGPGARRGPLGPPATVPGLPPIPAPAGPPGAFDAPSAPLPQSPPPANATAPIWQPAPPAPPARRKRSKARLVVLAIAVVVITGVVGNAMHAASGALPPGTSAFAHGDGVDYTSSDGSYTVQFPKAPVASQSSEQIGQYTATLAYASVTTNDYEMATASIVLPAAPTGSLATQLLNDAMNSGIAKSGGAVQHQENIIRGGMPALHATFEAPDGYTAEGLVILQGKWLFVLFVHAKTGTTKLYAALEKSFTPNVLP